MHRWIKLASLALLIALGLWSYTYFTMSEREQVLRVQQRFLTAVEERDWGTLHALLSEDYMDDWGHDKATVEAALRQWLGQFLALSIESKPEKVQVVKGLAMIVTKLKLDGRGLGLSNEIVSQANTLRTPWFFHWHKRGRWPWSWELVQVHNDGL
jgi:hypothetical protein